MWWALWMAGQAAPAPEVIDDIPRWEREARALLDGPDACVRVQGKVTLHVSLFTAGGWLSAGQRRDLVASGTFDGQLDHGTWTRLETTWEPSEGPDRLTPGRFHPIVGRLLPIPEGEPAPATKIELGSMSFVLGEGRDEAPGLLDQLLNEIDAETTASYTRWDDARGALDLFQEVPLDSGGRLVVQTAFPDAGPPTAMDATFPPKVKVGGSMLKVALMDGQLHLRGRMTSLGALPGEEGLSVVVGALGFTAGYEQRVSYVRAAACGG